MSFVKRMNINLSDFTSQEIISLIFYHIMKGRVRSRENAVVGVVTNDMSVS